MAADENDPQDIRYVPEVDQIGVFLGSGPRDEDDENLVAESTEEDYSQEQQTSDALDTGDGQLPFDSDLTEESSSH